MEDACAVLSDGHIECWGGNRYGQLGDGTHEGSLTPIEVSGISSATSVSAGPYDTCAILSGGSVDCWGENLSGQVGNGVHLPRKNGEEFDVTTPAEVVGLSGVTAVQSGFQATCARLSGGQIDCWGSNNTGALGEGPPFHAESSTPVEVSGISGATGIAQGNDALCAPLSEGGVDCWGLEHGGYQPTPVSGVSNVTEVAMNNNRVCALLSSGKIECWGKYNEEGQFGDGTTEGSTTPVLVSDITNATSVGAGYWHTCALLSGGSIDCWGNNSSGQLGIGTYEPLKSTTPVSVLKFP
jgi:alpha-tubulin suppressor-like RCC1 family protein